MEKNKLNSFRNFIIPKRFDLDVETVEKSLKDISDVLFAKIVLAEDKNIKEIHVITRNSSNPKKITRDIESFLLAKYNIQVDYRKISIAQVKEDKINDESDKETVSSLPSRLKFVDLKVTTVGDYSEIIVRLEENNKVFEGKVSGKNWSENQQYLVAKATLESISSYLEGSTFLQLDELKKVNLDGKEAVVASIYLIEARGKEHLIGSTLVGDDFNKAIVKAILKATNRRILIK
ncbi:MAG: hypothetical protein Kow00103_12870 [Candidatus Caldatribacteriota bacterium]